MFKWTPFLVCRGRILHALDWLKANNPLYHNIVIDLDALAEYPADDNGHVPFPIQHQSVNGTIQSSCIHGQTARHGIDTTEAIFSDCTDEDS